MKQGNVIDLDGDLSIFAARLGKECNLALADSIIYATAQKHNCILWTQDKHFKDLKSVRYFRKKSNSG
jgi:predicted nucleic acid-binding protein